MRFVTQFYVQPSNVRGNLLFLVGGEARHVVQVLRHKKGDKIVASDGLGKTYEAELVTAFPKQVEARILNTEIGKNESKTKVALAVGLTRGGKLDWLVEKATEMGIGAIWPFFARYSEVKWDKKQAEKSLARWQRIALAAFKQCGRSMIPQIEILKNLAEAVGRKGDEDLVAAHPAASSIAPVLPEGPLGQKVIAIIGPEGGFAPEELDWVRQAGGRLVSLGPRRLRTETAGLVLLAQILSLKAEL